MKNVEITTEEYTELMRAKIALEFLEEAYNGEESYTVDTLLKILFGKAEEDK